MCSFLVKLLKKQHNRSKMPEIKTREGPGDY